MSKKINLEEILKVHSNICIDDRQHVVEAMEEACRQALELAAENASIKHFYYDRDDERDMYEKYREDGFVRTDGDGMPYGVDITLIDKDSILNTINQIE